MESSNNYIYREAHTNTYLLGECKQQQQQHQELVMNYLQCFRVQMAHDGLTECSQNTVRWIRWTGAHQTFLPHLHRLCETPRWLYLHFGAVLLTTRHNFSLVLLRTEPKYFIIFIAFCLVQKLLDFHFLDWSESSRKRVPSHQSNNETDTALSHSTENRTEKERDKYEINRSNNGPI